MKNSIVIGSLFGDEGKGVTVNWLCKNAVKNGENPIVVRFNGGAQAAHTVVLNGICHVFSSFGSGSMLGVDTFLEDRVFVDPISIANEYIVLSEKITKVPRLYCSPYCSVVTPYDIKAGLSDKKVMNDGSCGMGIFKTFLREKKHDCDILQLVYLGERSKTAICYDCVDSYLEKAAKFHGFDRDSEIERKFISALEFIIDNEILLLSAQPLFSYDRYIFEGAQGLLLDKDKGFYPNVTPSSTGLDNISEKMLTNADVYLVARTYMTRHGNGYVFEKKNVYNIDNKFETCIDNDTQGKFKTGIFDFRLLRRAIDRHNLDVWQKKHGLKYHISVTHCDVMENKIGLPSFAFVNKLGKEEQIAVVDENFNDFFMRIFDEEIGDIIEISSVVCNFSPESNFVE